MSSEDAAIPNSYGPYTPGVAVSETIEVLIGYTAKGLPTGLKFDAKTGTISGTPTKPTGGAGATVTFTKKGDETLTTQIVVGPLPVLTVEAVGDGKVTGAGAHVANKKVTLKATADKGNVFVGWYADEKSAAEGGGRGTTALPISRATSYAHTMSTNDVTLYAKFIAQADDWAQVDCAIADEYATGVAIEPIAVSVESGSLPTVKVTGLPTGLKFTAKEMATSSAYYPANTIYGTPTKSGVYAVTVAATTAGKVTAKETFKIVVRADGEAVVDAEWETAKGKVTGMGICANGKTLTLKAVANKGYVFAGWYSDVAIPTCGDEACGWAYQDPVAGTADYRTESLAVKGGGSDTTYYARFVAASEDTEIRANVEDEYSVNGTWTQKLDIDSLSLPSVTVKGLPTGLKFDAKTLTISGTPTKPGVYTITLSLKNATVKKALQRKFTIVVDNLTGANDMLVCTDAEGDVTALANTRGESYMLTVGVLELSLPRKIVATAGTVKVTGLPTGLKYDAKTGAISGVATKTGTYTVYVTVGKAVSTFTVTVEALPTWAVGTFVGVLRQVDRDTDGTILVDAGGERHDWYDVLATVTVASNGGVSGKIRLPEGNEGSFKFGSINLVDDEGRLHILGTVVGYGLKMNATFAIGSRSLTYDQNIEIGEMTVALSEVQKQSGKMWIDCSETTMATDDGAPLIQNTWKVQGVPLPPSVNGVTATVTIDGEEERFVNILKFGKAGRVVLTLYSADNLKKALTTGSSTLSILDYDGSQWTCELCSNLVIKKGESGETGVIDVTISSAGRVRCSYRVPEQLED